MDDAERDHPELSGDETDDARPLYGRRRRSLARVIVLIALVALVLPGALTVVNVGHRTAAYACALLGDHEGIARTRAAFEVFGRGVFGWECYGGDSFGPERHLDSLGPIPGVPDLPAEQRDA